MAHDMKHPPLEVHVAKRLPGKQASAKRSTKDSRPRAGRAKAVGATKRRANAVAAAPKRQAKPVAAAPKRHAKPVGAAPKRSAKSLRASRTVPRRTTATRAARSRPKAPARKPSMLGSVATAVRGTVAGAVAAVGRTISRRSATDAIGLLESDHRRMEDLLKRGEATTPGAVKRRRSLLDTVSSELAVHELIEETVFYPALRSHDEARGIVLEGLEEHHAANLIVRELHEVAADNEQWGAKFKVLQETIQHHIDEEEGEMFRTARGVLSADELAAMGKQMAALKADARRA